MNIKRCQERIITPISSAWIFAYQDQDIYLFSDLQIPDWQTLQEHFNKETSFYCFAKVGEHQCLLVDNLSHLHATDIIKPISIKKLLNTQSEHLITLIHLACHLNYWRLNNRYCGHCGTLMTDNIHDWARHCANCGHLSYPRISPSVIVLITRGEYMLLARSPRFRPGVYSTIAGYIEIGETAEETVAREVQEEVGISIHNIQYFASQPWPFPDSLMLGFTAEYLAGEIQVDNDEIIDAKWFAPNQLPELPSSMSIARRLIDYHLAQIRDDTESTIDINR